ncbi:MAG: AAA family ATPase [Pseudomonadota bacterium]
MLFERDNELDRLATLAAGLNDGSGRIVALGGEAGIGKSSLLEEFARRLPDRIDCFWGMCDALFTPRPLGPVQDVAEAMLGSGSSWRNEPGAGLFHLILAELKSRREPAVVIVEDAHWADAGTLDFIRFLGRRISLCPILLIVSFRDDEVDRDHPLRRVFADLPASRLDRLGLAPLSLEAVKQLSAESDRDAERLLEITGGNPFFVSEIVSSGSESTARVPESVQDAVASRLARLEDSHRAFLEALSLIPVPIEPGLHGSWIEDHEKWVEQSLRAGVLVQDNEGRLKFRHELARLATSQRCSALELVRLHEQHLALMLEQPNRFAAGEIVHHAKGAADAKAVLTYAPMAGAQAAHLGAHAEAAAYYETALDFIDEAAPEQAAELYDNWAYEAGIAINIDDRVIDARRHALTLWRALGRTDKIAENLRFLSRLHWYRGEAAQANRYLDESISLFEQLGDADRLAMAYSMRSQMLMLGSRMEDAIEWGQRAIATAGDPASVDVRVHALNNIGTAKLFLGREDGISDMRESLEIALKHNMHEDAARVYTNFSEYAVDLRKLQLAEEILEEGIAFDIEHDLDSWTFYLRGRLAQLRIEQGKLTEARAIAESVLEQPGQTMLMRLPARIMLARILLRQGAAGAQSMLEQARADSLKTAEVQYQIPVLLAMLEKAWLVDDPELAREAFTSLARISGDQFSHWGGGEYAFWLHLNGLDRPHDLGALPEPFQQICEGDPIAAAEMFDHLGSRYLAALCRGVSDDTTEISRALADLQDQGAQPAITRLTAIATGRGVARDTLKVPRGPYAAARANAYGLTAKEQVVLGMIAEGWSNAGIAERLSRSPRTVEHHVSSILQKLEVENRIAAMLKAQQDPELSQRLSKVEIQ